MSKLRKALPVLLLAAAALWVFTDSRGPIRAPLHPKTVWAQANNTPYDTIWSETLTAATTGTTIANSFSAGQSMSRSWTVEYYTDGFSALSIQFETADRTSGNVPGSWTAVPNTICSSSVQPPCLIDGANPKTTTGYGTFSIRAYAPFVRVNVTSVTGSGHINYRVYGYKGLSANAGSGTGGSGANLTIAGTAPITATGAGCTPPNSGTCTIAGLTTNQNLRSVPITFDGGGTALVGSAQTAKHVPFSGTLTQLALTCEDATGNPLSGTATVDLLSVSLTNWIAGTSPTTIHGSGSACTFTTTFGANCSLTGWSTTIAADTMLAAALSSPTNCVRVAVDAVISAN